MLIYDICKILSSKWEILIKIISLQFHLAENLFQWWKKNKNFARF